MFYIKILILVFLVRVKSYSQIPFNGQILFVNISSRLNETSGIIYWGNLLWTFNDSGGRAKLFGLSPENGKIEKIIKIKNARNYDWEDITQDENYIYIGDFGNNFGNRKNLVIYKIAKTDIGQNKKNKVIATKISFSYESQVDFKISLGQTSYDCEAIASYNDSLLLVSKDWQNMQPFVYLLSKNPGNYSLKEKAIIPNKGLITGADTDESNHLLWLCGRNMDSPFIMAIELEADGFVISNTWLIELPFLRGMQIEGIAVSDNVIYLSAEASLLQQRIYKITGLSLR